jgi:Tfp pilus assembly protein PilN
MASVPAIGLDFIRPSGRASRLGPILLLVGALVAMGVAEMHRHASSELRTRQERVDELERMSRRNLPAIEGKQSDTPEMREQIKRANAVLAQMNVPWDELFAAVESAQDGSVAVLSVQPDARDQVIALTGAAHNLDAVLGYMKRLESTQRLMDVVLASHELKVKEPGQPVEFALTAHWVDAR